MKTYLSPVLLSLCLSLLLCDLLIPVLRKLKAGQNILSYVKEHTSKSGTPTMGGIAFVAAAVLVCLLWLPQEDKTSVLCLALGLSYMAVGLLDDFLKKKHGKNLGLRAWQKLVFQTAIALFCGVYCIRAGLTEWNIPFTEKRIALGGWIFPLCVFLFLATVNAVNLTDGLDGLAAGVSLPYFAFFGALIALQTGERTGVALISLCLVGALVGYLAFNVSPASVFMGDTGSLALGGFATAIPLFSGNALYIPLVGVCFLFSVISVAVQVIYYKATGGKRIFRMAPAHHHFQQTGYAESKISYAYFALTFSVSLLCLIGA